MLLLTYALLAFFAVLATAQSSNSSDDDSDTHVTCAAGVNQNTTFNWWNNKRGQNPCQVLQNLLRKCDPGHTIHAMPESPLQRPDICQQTKSNNNDNGGNGGEDGPNNFIPCCCNTAAYALRQACWSCQHGAIDPSAGDRRPTFREYLQCPKNVNKALKLYQNVSVPHWAFIPVDPDNTWNLTFTSSLVAQPEVLNTIIMMNIESVTNGTGGGGGESGDDNSQWGQGNGGGYGGSQSGQNSSGGGGKHDDSHSNTNTTQVVAAILGGALSGLALVVVLLLLILYIRRRRREARRSALQEWVRQHDWQSRSPMLETDMEQVSSPPPSLSRGKQGRELFMPRAQATYDPEDDMFEEQSTRHLKLSDPRVSDSFQWEAKTPARPFTRRTAMNSVATNFSL